MHALRQEWIILLILVDAENDAFAAAHDLELEAAVVNAESVIEHVAYLVPVYCRQFVSGKYSDTLSRRIGLNKGYFYHEAAAPLRITEIS